jgi:DNA-binding IscR family transcriptional regulator
LNQPPSEISVLQIVESLEGPIALNPCSDSGQNCTHQENCATQELWGDVQQRLVLQLASTTLENLACSEQGDLSDMPVYSSADLA